MEPFFKYIELVGGALASIITIIVFFKIVVLPFFVKLQIQLTKDLFFRLTNSGEIFFPRIIIHAPLNMQIIDCSFELKGKKDTQETLYICKAEKFGSVERNSINDLSVPSFYLPRYSPELLLKKRESKDMLIQCSIIESKTKIKESIDLLWYDYNKLLSQQPTVENQKYFLEHTLKKYSTNILSNIKLESGDHILVCKISYKYKHSFKTRIKTVESTVKINITESSLNMYKNQISVENFLLDYLSVLNPKNKNIKIRHPECGIN